ncbi:MAG: DNA-formamidopyrimidine glycosylase [Bacteroidetes bacterium]|nr:MAG: DNA-formamidopyrimidine glycosylase [Bacteroidota bacterium]
MPELPEVEMIRRYAEGTALRQPIHEVTAVHEGRMIPGGLARLRETLLGHQFTHTSRVGKFLFFHLDHGPVLMLHFGLTGDLRYHHDPADAPRFARVTLHMGQGARLSIASQRKFSRLEVAPDVTSFRARRKLGVDALEISEAAFAQAIQGRKAPLKAVLLEQKHFAGVGNWIADEMLYQTRLAPDICCHELPDGALPALYQSLREILLTAIDREARYEAFPAHFMVQQRWEKGHCPRCQTQLVRIVVGGRGTYFCPRCQPSGAESSVLA